MLDTLERIEVLKLPVSQVKPDPLQPRKTFNTTQDEELIGSFQVNRQLVPIIVYKHEDHWIIVDGERRWRSATSLSWETIEAKVLASKPSESQILVLQLTTNCQRSDLHPLDRLDAFKHLMRLSNWKAAELASQLALSKPTISRILSLDRFNDAEKSLLRNGVITTTEAYGLARLSEAERTLKLEDVMGGSHSERTLPNTSLPSTQTLTLNINGTSIRLRGQACSSFDSMLEALSALIRECKRAKREGIDPKTFARVLQDKSQASDQESNHA